MISKIKKLFGMKKEKQDLQVDAYNENFTPEEAVADTSDIGSATVEEVLEQEDVEDIVYEEASNAKADKTFLEASPEAIGFENREHQWDTYRVMSQYFSPEDSVLDFGCARGDFNSFYLNEYNEELEYTGIDFNKQLIDAGHKANPDYDLIHGDWMNTKESADWCINIGSNDLRYDADLTTENLNYLVNTIKQMYNCCNKGMAIMLASDILQQGDGMLTWNAGEILNMALNDYRTAVVDHSYSDAVFTLIIYKN